MAFRRDAKRLRGFDAPISGAPVWQYCSDRVVSETEHAVRIATIL